MPFKSKKQARWMFATHPKMARRWARHTKSMKRLPEMPHFDSEVDTPRHHNVTGIDLKVERYPMPPAGKKRLLQNFQRGGLVGQLDGEWLHFKADNTVEVISAAEAQGLPKLPNDWESHAEFISESVGRLPKLVDLFERGG